METFYFTYGTSGQPFRGGWTVIEAPDRKSAIALFRAYHPDKTKDLLNCSDIYDSASFTRTEMYKHGNCGKRCVERICVTRVINV